MTNNLTTDLIVVPDLRKRVDPDLLKEVGYLMGSIPNSPHSSNSLSLLFFFALLFLNPKNVISTFLSYFN